MKTEANSPPPSTGLLAGGDRLPLVVALLGLLFVVLAGRLVLFGFDEPDERRGRAGATAQQAKARPELTDRTGALLAIDRPMASLYADPRHVARPLETAQKLAAVLPELDVASVAADLAQPKHFVWIKRFMSADEQARVAQLALPGLEFMDEPKRFYPQGALTAHVTGFVDLNNNGLSGMEKALDDAAKKGPSPTSPQAAGNGPVALSIDLRVQHAVDVELRAAMATFRAVAAAGLVLDIDSGEILALVSLPSFEPHNRAEAQQEDRIDRARRGVYELGSIMKCFTVAMGIDEGAFGLEDRIDTATPLKLGSFTIKDHAPHGDGTMTLEDIFVHSSNVGAARIARKVGLDRHRAFIERLGLLDRLDTEAGSAGLPLKPASWQLADSLSIAFGYRLSVSPLQFAAAAMPLFNGGYRRPVSFLRREAGEKPAAGIPVLKSETVQLLRRFMRDNVESGTGRLADVPAYQVGGKTGTARKVSNGVYSDALRTSFLGIFPAAQPRYLTLVLLDEPQAVGEGGDRNNASMNAAPTTARIVERIAPFLGVKPLLAADN